MPTILDPGGDPLLDPDGGELLDGPEDGAPAIDPYAHQAGKSSPVGSATFPIGIRAPEPAGSVLTEDGDVLVSEDGDTLIWE